MLIGSMRDRIVIESPTEITDSFGANTKTYATYKSVMACVQEKSGTESRVVEQLKGIMHYEIGIWYLPVNSKMQVKTRGRTLQIIATKNDDSMTFTTIYAVESV